MLKERYNTQIKIWYFHTPTSLILPAQTSELSLLKLWKYCKQTVNTTHGGVKAENCVCLPVTSIHPNIPLTPKSNPERRCWMLSDFFPSISYLTIIKCDSLLLFILSQTHSVSTKSLLGQAFTSFPGLRSVSFGWPPAPRRLPHNPLCVCVRFLAVNHRIHSTCLKAFLQRRTKLSPQA